MNCCKVKPSELRHLIQIERETYTPDGAGGNTRAWTVQKNLKAKIKPMRGNERLQAMRLEATISHVITVRYVDGILPSDRVKFGSRIMQIRAVINVDEMNRYIELYCDEGAPT